MNFIRLERERAIEGSLVAHQLRAVRGSARRGCRLCRFLSPVLSFTLAVDRIGHNDIGGVWRCRQCVLGIPKINQVVARSVRVLAIASADPWFPAATISG